MNVNMANRNITIINNDVLKCTEIKKESVDLIITSPPYGVGIEYGTHNDRMGAENYFTWVRQWMKVCYEWLSDTGRACINVSLDVNRPHKLPLSALYTTIAMDVGFNYHATIVWNKAGLARDSTAWGSWLSASAPSITPRVEVIIVLCKGNWKKNKQGKTNINRHDFMTWVRGQWKIQSESAKRIGHPAPFPVELPMRCIKLFSFDDELILDPFCGSGSTLVAAVKENRNAIGIDIDQDYCKIATERVRLAKIAASQLRML